MDLPAGLLPFDTQGGAVREEPRIWGRRVSSSSGGPRPPSRRLVPGVARALSESGPLAGAVPGTSRRIDLRSEGWYRAHVRPNTPARGLGRPIQTRRVGTMLIDARPPPGSSPKRHRLIPRDAVRPPGATVPTGHRYLLRHDEILVTGGAGLSVVSAARSSQPGMRSWSGRPDTASRPAPGGPRYTT